MWDVTFITSYKGPFELEKKMYTYLECGWEPVSFTHVIQGMGGEYTVMLRCKKETK
jgi:hypothetical protein